MEARLRRKTINPFNSLFGIRSSMMKRRLSIHDLSTPFSGFSSSFFSLSFISMFPFNSLFGIPRDAKFYIVVTDLKLSTPFSGFSRKRSLLFCLLSSCLSTPFSGFRRSWKIAASLLYDFQLPFRDSVVGKGTVTMLLYDTFNSLFGILLLKFFDTDSNRVSFNSLFGILNIKKFRIFKILKTFNSLFGIQAVVTQPHPVYIHESFQLPFRDSMLLDVSNNVKMQPFNSLFGIQESGFGLPEVVPGLSTPFSGFLECQLPWAGPEIDLSTPFSGFRAARSRGGERCPPLFQLPFRDSALIGMIVGVAIWYLSTPFSGFQA